MQILLKIKQALEALTLTLTLPLPLPLPLTLTLPLTLPRRSRRGTRA